MDSDFPTQTNRYNCVGKGKVDLATSGVTLPRGHELDGCEHAGFDFVFAQFG